MKKLLTKFLVSILSLNLSLPAFSQKIILINGAGATFPYPLYSKWFYEYAKIDKTVNFNYQSIGSGGGIRQIIAKTVDFGATDAVMTKEQEKQAGEEILHIPMTAGAVVLIYNVPELKQQLNLSAELISGIFLGKITRWNDKKIQQENPGVNLPNKKIIVARRSDGSGTTFIFTDYLCEVSNEWKSKVGKGTSVNWPVGLGGKGNEGVAGIVKNTPYSIGYVEISYAIQNNLSYAKVKNKAGKYISPSVEAITAAIEEKAKNMPADYKVSIVNPDGEKAYPICGFTWLLVYKKQQDKQKGEKLVNFLKWAVTDGQKYCADLIYAPLPDNLVKMVLETIKKIEY
ncbi:MAG: phosphate ABC transporter substrate-binding protein PstS [Endomicrobiia bacterium]